MKEKKKRKKNKKKIKPNKINLNLKISKILTRYLENIAMLNNKATKENKNKPWIMKSMKKN